MKPKVLLIEDSAGFRKAVSGNLITNGYEVLEAGSGKIGVSTALREQPDLIILDLFMPGMHGFEVCRRLKQELRTAGIPVLVLTGNDREGQDITCLDLGADDYLSKPVRKERLLSHCRALLRRAGRLSDAGVARLGPLELDQSMKVVRLHGTDFPHLTPKEFALLHELAVSSPKPRDRDTLYRKLWEQDPPSEASLKTVDVHVGRIRTKLGWQTDEWLLGVHGRGYCLVPPGP